MESTFTKFAQLAKATQLTPTQRKHLVFALIQDEHVSQQRLEFTKFSHTFENLTINGVMLPTGFTWVNEEWFYYILLKNRFKPGTLTDNEQLHFQGLQNWLNTYAPPCIICGMYPLGYMCKYTDLYPAIYLQWPDEEEGSTEAEEPQVGGSEFGITFQSYIKDAPLQPFRPI
jgi:hypothetical protein